MSNSGTAGSREIKKVMRTALIGIKPADLIMLKGYLRVLLRLEADLEWVPASHPSIDLYIINDEFRGSTSVHKILRNQSKDKVLYVRRSDNAEGMMSDNLIILPLQDLKALSSWLYSNLPFLQNDVSASSSDSTQTLASNNSNVATTVKESQPETEQSTHVSSNTTTTYPADDNGLFAVIDAIQTRPDGLYELSCSQGKIALVNLARQRIWLVGEGSVTPNASWKLQPTTRAVSPDISKSIDLFQWLWQQAWSAPDNLLSMISDEETYQLRYWPKPRMTGKRKELAHLLTAMEAQPILVRDLAVRADTSVNAAKKVVASLLFAGGLHAETYEKLKKFGNSAAKSSSNITSNSSTTGSSTGSTQNTPKPSVAVKQKRSFLDEILARRSSGDTSAAATTESQANTGGNNSAKEEKLGFLAKIRRKLGL
ncbi:hypothetical protein [Psychrobacter sp. I-STPA10]|uniref:hypothetical protein n=1 Tax=Psychrobacter sp. I-STPA10 TaxID=2585769 RepID=UPI001E5C8837|nr:hypothetical protein [Psychrobacter sp. I-STPA10]